MVSEEGRDADLRRSQASCHHHQCRTRGPSQNFEGCSVASGNPTENLLPTILILASIPNFPAKTPLYPLPLKSQVPDAVIMRDRQLELLHRVAGTLCWPCKG